jgi:2-polyprenyl-3-methyl-5-hydroxy-6-metoxy-1,4-benzoquinol methylase
MESNKFYSNYNSSELKKLYPYTTVPFINELTIKKGMDVLDIGGFGCAGLNTSLYLKEKGCVVDVINIDKNVEKYCKKFNVKFIHSDIFNYDVTEKKYDIIILELVIENQIDIYKENLIDKLKQMLKPDGCVLTFFTDDITNIPIHRLKEVKDIVKKFSNDYLNNIPIEKIYEKEFIGLDNRKYMKWFKFKNEN